MLKTLISILCLVIVSGVANADTKVKIRQTSGGQTYENATYIKGKRQRSETNGGQMVTITQCDLRRSITIMPQMQTYMIQPFGDPSATNPANTTGPRPAAQPVTKGGLVTSTVTTRDTGERKQMFGYQARHIITTMVMESSPDACSQTKTKMEIDGWYIDATFALDCDLGSAYQNYQPPATPGGCRDRYVTKTVGTAKKGFPVWEKTTMFGPDGTQSFTTTSEVLEFSQATLEASLFEPPAGYREVKDFASMYNTGMPSTPSADNPSSATTTNPTSTSPATTTNPSSPSKATEVLPAKKPGMIRIGVVAVKVDKVTEGMNAANLATAVQTTLTEKLKAPNVEAVPIQATVLSQIEAEARQKECDYLVYTAISLKKGGGGFGSVFGSTAAQVAAATVPYGGSTTAAIATNTAASVVVADIKAKDELTVDVRLEKPGAGYPAFSKPFKGKAKSAGEDIVTPPTTQAAQALIEAATKK